MGVLDDIKNSIGDHGSSDKNKSGRKAPSNSYGKSSSDPQSSSNNFDSLNNNSQRAQNSLQNQQSGRSQNHSRGSQKNQGPQSNSRQKRNDQGNVGRNQDFDFGDKTSQQNSGTQQNSFQNSQQDLNQPSQNRGRQRSQEGSQNLSQNSGGRNRAHRSGFPDSPNTQAGRPEKGSSKPQVSDNTRKKMENAGFNRENKSDIGQLKSQNEQIIELLKRINQNLERI